ncbi:hypothetical protein IFR04_016246 [Cadophora malorum]|uniref:Antifreeze protein n=1 Tax=Cadophora malorum TaxID=108018 RepID=A0A8H7SZU9_9HELO|nr:hypothetical protein IFR04_016246 [Cadophora malorum]
MSLLVILGVFELFTLCSAQIDLGTAEPYGIYGAASVTNTGATVINGDLGTGGTSVTGFPPGIINGDLAVGGQTTTVDLDATAAFTTINGLGSDADLTGQDLGNQNLLPGTYTFTAAAQLTGTLTLVGTGSADDAWYFQIGTALTTASNSAVLINGGQECQVFWAVGSSATIGLGTSFIGTILADQSVTFGTGASLAGRAFGLGATVTLDTNVVNVPAACAVASSSSIAQPSSTPSVPASLGSTSASNILTSTSLVPSSLTPSATNVPTDLSTGLPTSATVDPTTDPSTVATQSPTSTTPLSTVQPSSVPLSATFTGTFTSLSTAGP